MVALGMREPLTDAELAATIDADKAHFSRTIKSLIEQKYVEFLPSPKHKLQRHLYLSKKGKKLVEAYTGDKNRALAEVVEDMTEEQARALQILAKFFINEKQVTAFHHVKIQKCDYDDLSWLVHHRDFLLDGEDNRRLYLVMNAMDLVEHLTQNVIKVQHSWLVSDWGKRIGGCVLSYERENIAIAWIKLLILPADRKVALKLLRACIASAETQGYEMIQIWHAETQ